MNFYLMHKNGIVALMDIDNSGKLSKVQFNNDLKSHLPVGGQMNMMKFHDWWKDRAVPKSRKGAMQSLRKLGYTSTSNMLIDNLALSLNDCYWIKPVGSQANWEQVNLFSNNFIDIIVE